MFYTMRQKYVGVVTAAFLSAALPLWAQNTSVLTAEYENGRSASNGSETVLTPATVNAATFGKLGSYNVDGQVAGQPLYVSKLKMPGKGNTQTNVLYVATMHNTVYAFDADHPGTAPLWSVNLGPSVPQNYAGTCPANFSTGTELGILSTPVIDSKSGTIYVVAAHPVPGTMAYIHQLYALDLTTGAAKNGGSAVISAQVPGTGVDSSNGTVTMNQTRMIQRPALLLANGSVYAGFSSCGPDPDPYHGWVIGYNAANVQQQTVAYNSTPNGEEGGIWQSGAGLVADGKGFIYFETGNGTSDDVSNFGESFVKLTPTGTVADWFTPSNADALNALDLDLSTTGPILTSDTHLLIGVGKQRGAVLGGGKQGIVYVLSADSLGGKSGQTGPVQAIPTDGCTADTFSGCQKLHSLAYWPSATTPAFYTWGTGDVLRAYSFVNGQFTTTPTSTGGEQVSYPGGILAVSHAHGAPGTAIVWALTPSELHAFDASNVAIELWNSNQNGARDGLAGNYHFGQFTVVNGTVYVPDAQNHIVVYGLLPGLAGKK